MAGELLKNCQCVCEEMIAFWAAKFSSITEDNDLMVIKSSGEIG
jgi:hypothetical protein